jgi:hypothetical protein
MVPRVLSLHWRNFVLVLSLERVTGIEPAWLSVNEKEGIEAGFYLSAAG